MKHRIWLPILVVISTSLACGKPEEKVSDTSPSPAADTTPTPPPSFTLKVTFEGLVGYLNKTSNVWALLPKARRDTMPPGFDPNSLHDYPEHYAFLKVNSANIKDFGDFGPILIPIDGKEIQVTDNFTSGSGIPNTLFRQTSATVDKIDPAVLSSTPPTTLAARVKLPLINANDWFVDEREDPSEDPHKFINVQPIRASANCTAPRHQSPDKPRVQAVTWQKTTLTNEFILRIKTFTGIEIPPLILVPTTGQNTIQVWIVNKDLLSLYDPTNQPHHWPAYRWFYNLSLPTQQADCEKHYYPQGELGGNRCPQKLYTE